MPGDTFRWSLPLSTSATDDRPRSSVERGKAAQSMPTRALRFLEDNGLGNGASRAAATVISVSRRGAAGGGRGASLKSSFRSRARATAGLLVSGGPLSTQKLVDQLQCPPWLESRRSASASSTEKAGVPPTALPGSKQTGGSGLTTNTKRTPPGHTLRSMLLE